MSDEPAKSLASSRCGASLDGRGSSRRVVGWCIPAVRTLVATLEVYDRAGGGLTANGLAYSALIALVPGALLVAGAIGLFITDPEIQQRLVDAIAAAVPPLEPIVQTALDSVAAGRGPDDRHRVHRPPVGVEPLLRLARLRVLEGVPRRAAPERGRAHAARASS